MALGIQNRWAKKLIKILINNTLTVNETMERLTEQPSKYNHLETKSVDELIANINNEDKLVALAV